MRFRPICLISAHTVLIILVSTRVIYAVPASPLHVTQLYQQSDIVVVGRVRDVVKQESASIDWYGACVSGRRMRATLQPEKLIKGSQAESIVFEFFKPDSSLAFKDISNGQYGMFFLKRCTLNVVSVTSLAHAYISAVPTPVRTAGVGLSRVALELALVLNSPTIMPGAKTNTIWALETVEHPSVTSILKHAFQTSDGQMKIKFAGALLRRSDTSVRKYAADILLGSTQPLDHDDLVELASNIEQAVHNWESLPYLTKLLSVKDARVRCRIAQAIRVIGTKSAIRPLSTLLFDEDAETRYVGVIGLAEITREYKWGPAQDEFHKDERRYLDHWQKWAKSRM